MNLTHKVAQTTVLDNTLLRLKLTYSAQKLLNRLLHGFFVNGQYVYASNATLSGWMGCAPRTVSHNIGILKHLGLIEVEYFADSRRIITPSELLLALTGGVEKVANYVKKHAVTEEVKQALKKVFQLFQKTAECLGVAPAQKSHKTANTHPPEQTPKPQSSGDSGRDNACVVPASHVPTSHIPAVSLPDSIKEFYHSFDKSAVFRERRDEMTRRIHAHTTSATHFSNYMKKFWGLLQQKAGGKVHIGATILKKCLQRGDLTVIW